MGETIAVKKSTLLIIGIFLALVLGFVFGLFAGPFLGLPSLNATGFLSAAVLSDSDRNFLVELANSQIALTSLRSASAADWCAANSGEWNYNRQFGELPVTKELADSYKKKGFVVNEKDGNFSVQVMVVSRDVCLMPAASGNSQD